jgi:4-hydroxyphenylpyruvate dioxygenase
MTLVAKSDQSTGNSVYASYALQSQDLVMTFTAPYALKAPGTSTCVPFPHYKPKEAFDFVCAHGLAVRAVGTPGIP